MFTSPWASRNLKELIDSFKLIIMKKKITLICKDNKNESTKLPPVHGLISCLLYVSFVQLIVNITGTQASSLCTLHLTRLLRRSGNLWSDCSQTFSPYYAKRRREVKRIGEE